MKYLYSKVLVITLIVLFILNIIAPVHQVYADNSKCVWITENNRLFNTRKPMIEWYYDGNQSAYKLDYSLSSTFSQFQTTDWINSSGNTYQFDKLLDNTYFVRGYIKDDNGNVTEIPGTLSFTVDLTLPEGAVVINEDQHYTSTTKVILNISAFDSNGVTHMSIKNLEDPQWGEWIPFKETFSWQLSEGEGQKIVNVRFKDIAGNISQIYIDNIILGEFTGSIEIEDGKSYVVDEAVNITIRGSNISEMRFSNDGVTWTEWEAFKELKKFTLSHENGRKVVFVQFRDYLGNVIEDKDVVMKGMGIPSSKYIVDDNTITDIKDHWAKNEIKELIGMGIVNGYPDKTFNPNGNILRGEFVKLITASMGLEPIVTMEPSFSDLENHWSKPYVEAALGAEIIIKSEYPNGFNPNGSITREEIAKIVVRAMGREDEAKARENELLDFTDANDINAKGFVKIAKELGIITGYPDGSFGPNAEASRGQASVMIVRMIKARHDNLVQGSTSQKLEEINIDFDRVNTSMVNLLTVKAVDANNKQVNLSDEEKVIFDSGSNYNDVEGVTCFRGNNFRDSASYGIVDIKDKQLEIVWSVPIGRIDTWSGVGWNGQPAIVKWSEEVKETMNINDVKKDKGDLKEVVYGALDGKVYFLDLENGEYTREPIVLPGPIKGSVSVDPRGIPLLYVGQGIDEVDGEEVEIGYRIYSLIDQEMLFFINGLDNFAYRGWGAFDSTALIDKHTDTMVVAGENGIFYRVKLNSSYDSVDGNISINPEMIKYRYWKNGNSYQGIENSVVMYRNLAFFADNGGWLQCVNINTMKPLWVQDVTDDTDSTIVLDEEDEGVFIYTACEVDKQGEEGFSYIRKINALTGYIEWEKAYKCISKVRVNRSASNGGAFATPIVGKHDLDNLVIFNLARCEEVDKGKIVALNKENGKELWTLELKNYSWSSPVDVYTEDGKGYIIVCNSAGIMYLLDGSNGTILDKVYLGSNVEGSPAVYDDMIVVGTRGQKIYGVKIK